MRTAGSHQGQDSIMTCGQSRACKPGDTLPPRGLSGSGWGGMPS